MNSSCTHLDQIRDIQSRTHMACDACFQMHGEWIHLRPCVICGNVGCCDSSLIRHATRHVHHAQHPLMGSFEPRADQAWHYVDEGMSQLLSQRP